MARLLNIETNQIENVNDEGASELIRSGNYLLSKVDKHYIEDENGKVDEFDPDLVQDALNDPLKRYVSQDEYNKKQEEKYYSTLPQQTLAGAEGAIETAIPFGGALLAKGYEKVGIDPAGMQKREDVNPITSTVGNVAGFLPGIFTGGSAVKVASEGAEQLAKQAVKKGLMSKLGQGVVKTTGAITTPNRIIYKSLDDVGAWVSKKVIRDGGTNLVTKSLASGLKLGSQAALQGAYFGIQDGVKDMVVQDKEFNAENMLNDVLMKGVQQSWDEGRLGAGLGLGGRLGYEVAKKSGGKAIKMTVNAVRSLSDKFRRKQADPVQIPINISAIPKASDILNKDKSVVFRPAKDMDSGDLIYSFKTKGRNYLLDAQDASSKILDFSDTTKVFDDVAEVYQMPRNLPYEKVVDTKNLANNPDAEIKRTLLFFMPDLPIDKKTAFRKGTEAQKNLIQALDKRDIILPLIEKRDELSSSAKSKLTKDIRDIRISLWHLSDDKSLKREFGNFGASFEELMRSKYAGYKIGNSYVVPRPEMIKDAIFDQSSLINIDKAIDSKKIPEHIKYFLKSASLSKPFIRKTPPERLIKAGEYIEKNASIGDGGAKEFIGDLDLLAENAYKDRNVSGRLIEDSINEANNVLDSIGRGEVSGNRIVNDLENLFIKPNVRGIQKTSKGNFYDASPLQQKFIAKIMPYIDEFKDMAHRQQSGDMSINLRTLWDLRKNIDGDIKQYHADQITKRLPPEMDEFRRDLRWYVEELIMSEMESIPGGEEVLAKYLAAKDTYSTVMDVEKLLGESMAREAANNTIPLGGYAASPGFTLLGTKMGDFMAKGVEVGAGGTLGMAVGSALPFVGGGVGTVAGMAGVLAYKKYGNYLIGKALKKMHDKNIRTFKEIDSTIIKFFEAKATKGIRLSTPLFEDDDLDKQYFKDKKELSELNLDANNYMEKIQSSNGDFFSLMPEQAMPMAEKSLIAINFLNEKFPRAPIDEITTEWVPKKSDITRYLRYKNAVLNPSSILDHLGQQYISSEEMEVLNEVYPSLKAKISTKLMEKWNMKGLNSAQKRIMNLLLGTSIDQTFTPAGINFFSDRGGEQEQQQGSQMRKSSYELSGQEQTQNDRISTK